MHKTMRNCYGIHRAIAGGKASLAMLTLLAVLTFLASQRAQAQKTATPPQGPIQYSQKTRTAPRPLRIHCLKIDLQDKSYELGVAIGNDPDGKGPVEAALTSPRTLAQRERFVAAVNTNPWKMVRPGVGYVVDGESDISGWVKKRKETRSAPQAGNWSFWIDKAGVAHVANVAQPVPAQCAVAGFGGLLQNGQLLPAASDVRHPRTALGLDRSGRWLTLLVVDGRQTGYSEGVSLRELASMMQQVGCWNALNLDGGGSSIMLLADDNNKLQTKNRPSGLGGARPIPTMLGVRKK